MPWCNGEYDDLNDIRFISLKIKYLPCGTLHIGPQQIANLDHSTMHRKIVDLDFAQLLECNNSRDLSGHHACMMAQVHTSRHCHLLGPSILLSSTVIVSPRSQCSTYSSHVTSWYMYMVQKLYSDSKKFPVLSLSATSHLKLNIFSLHSKNLHLSNLGA